MRLAGEGAAITGTGFLERVLIRVPKGSKMKDLRVGFRTFAAKMVEQVCVLKKKPPVVST